MGFRDNRISHLLTGAISRAGPGRWRRRSEAKAYEEAVRAAFNADTPPDEQDLAWSGGPDPDPGWSSTLLGASIATSDATIASPDVEAVAASASIPLTRPVFRAVEPERGKKDVRGRRSRVDEAVPDFLLHPPTNAAPVADEFFDGLIRWVEDER